MMASLNPELDLHFSVTRIAAMPVWIRCWYVRILHRSENVTLSLLVTACTVADALRVQARYSNTSEIELKDVDVIPTDVTDLPLYPMGTKVAKQSEIADQKLEWFGGEGRRYDTDGNLR
jgi:hypothetical protein